MIRRFLPLCLGLLLVYGVLAPVPAATQQGDPTVNSGGDDPPRLKKKKREGMVPPAEPPKDDKPTDPPPGQDGTGKGKQPIDLPKEPVVKPGKGKEPIDKPSKGKEPGGADEPLLPEDRPRADPEEDEAEILERINRNMRAVEDKLGNRELGEATEQQQRDILNDIDSLIRRSQEGGGGGGQNQQDQHNQDQASQQQAQQGGQGQQGGLSRAEKRRQDRMQARNQNSRQQKQHQQRQQAQSRPQRGDQPGEPLAGGKHPQPLPKGSNQPQPMGGDQPGAGRTGPTSDKQREIELTKEIWGHLPESLRAEMNAYSNPQPFMPRYDDLIKKYYKAIAEKGRKKGD
ncbi:MAG: hypothetical protein SNJ82_00775 [Gemmataceae bacterium]